MSVPAVVINEEGKVVGPRGAKAYKKWVPKEWRPEYEAIVALSCTGLSNKDVGARFGYGPQQVSNICNTPQGKKLREIIAVRLRESLATTFEERLAALGDEAIKNIETVIRDENVLKKRPIEMFDRSVELLKILGRVKKDSLPPQTSASPFIGNANNVLMVLGNEAQRVLAEANEKANRVAEIHAPK